MEWERLSEPFSDEDLEWRIQSQGFTKDQKPWAIIVPYINARAVVDRLDAVVGPDNWTDKFEHLLDGSGKLMGVKCTISIKSRGEWIGKVDGSEETEIEAFKGGFSKAFVRAAVKWGIGRYLYDTPQTFANFCEKNTPGAKYTKIKEAPTGKQGFYWTPPKIASPPKVENKAQDAFCAHCGKVIVYHATKSLWACTEKKYTRDAHTALKPSELAEFKKKQGENVKENHKPNLGVKTPEEESQDGKLHTCSLCGKGLILSRDRTGYFCPSYKDKSKGIHTSIKNFAAFAEKENETTPPDKP